VGAARRLGRLLNHATGKMLLVPFDDSLIAGPRGGLENMEAKLRLVFETPPDAVLGFPGLFVRNGHIVARSAWILNLTASTTVGTHTRKVQVATVQQAIALGCEAVAVHVNVTSRYEPEMLETLGRVVGEANGQGMPVLGIVYPRSEGADGSDDNHTVMRDANAVEYAELIAHSCRLAVELGVDLVKTQYSGHPETFRQVVQAASPVPVLIAGGPMVSEKDACRLARDAMQSGAAGVSFGRNVFGREDPRGLLLALREIIHGET
ncbi:MAG: hypothetical protein WD229_16740, partial [Pirellulales bacterium]